ncbi:uncharacterized protein LOC142985259 isoform X2 [Anticarsia gemmatalis]
MLAYTFASHHHAPHDIEHDEKAQHIDIIKTIQLIHTHMKSPQTITDELRSNNGSKIDNNEDHLRQLFLAKKPILKKKLSKLKSLLKKEQKKSKEVLTANGEVYNMWAKFFEWRLKLRTREFLTGARTNRRKIEDILRSFDAEPDNEELLKAAIKMLKWFDVHGSKKKPIS